MEKIRKMRFFQPHDYVAVDYVTRYAAISSLDPFGASGRPGVAHRRLEVEDVEPLRAEIESFLVAAESRVAPPITGEDGRRALALALRVNESIHAHDTRSGINALNQRAAAIAEL
jgi:predicted dehydrogenase